MGLAPGIVVVVVDSFGHHAANQFAHTLDGDLAAGIGIAPGQLHAGNIGAAKIRILIQKRGGYIHALLAAGLLQIMRGGAVTEAPAAEMGAVPGMASLALDDVDIMIAGARSTKLPCREATKPLH